METTLLAGPILRRTTKNRVCVWLVTSEPMSIQLTVMDAQKNPLGKSKLEEIEKQRVQMGKNFYVYLLQARPNNTDGFPRDTLLLYNLDKVEAKNNICSALFSDEALAKLAYGSLTHPSFFIPTKLNNLLHGSCRKPHGGSKAENDTTPPDALSHGHTLLEENQHDLEKRPATLLLTGDQIYADDVAISLSAMLRQAALTLTYRQETLPLSDNNISSDDRLDPSSIPLHGRKKELKNRHSAIGRKSGFSSNESENHLFTFGEFSAMYIYAFGNLPNWQPMWDWQQLENMGVAEGAKEAWTEQLEPLKKFNSTLPDIRKLMANIPTYMTFDDHDVTDDWNINGNWYDKVRKSPLGRRIVSNALASFWCFQGWGNDPDNFDKDLILSITQYLNDKHNDAGIAERYELHTWKSRGWGFSIPTDPPIISIDTRTQRQYENKFYPAQLLDRYALDWLRVEWSKLKTGQKIDNDTCPVFITATPVMGYSTIEKLQHFVLWLAGMIESNAWVRRAEQLIDKEGALTGLFVNKLDIESWSSNKEGFVRFMDTLCKHMHIKRCVFLSGDVHYAFTAKTSFKHSNHMMNCYQLTSSALNNKINAKQSHFLEDNAKHKTDKKTDCHWSTNTHPYWRTEMQLVPVENSNLRVNTQCNLGLVEFSNGLPVSHTLLTGKGKLVYRC